MIHLTRTYLYMEIIKASFSNGSIDVGNAPAITTQGQITYLGSYSGNNTIPLGQISKNLYASTIIGQRNKFPNYSMFLEDTLKKMLKHGSVVK